MSFVMDNGMLSLARPIFHIFLHFFVPFLVARYFFGEKYFRPWLIMSATILVDLDHLLADPIFDPNRCSIGFHPLHSYYAIAMYAVLTAFAKTRLLGSGFLIHMFLDGIDCLCMLL
ncbi:DUF6122 family protein [Candidatus Riflebacteria bacterium]